MGRSESKYFNTSERMDEALFSLIEKKDLEFITVKEICEKASVNRSTFYLHYESIGDLLDECLVYLLRRFQGSFGGKANESVRNISDAPLAELNFISPDYLLPYLSFVFVKENARFFQTAVLHARLFGSVKMAEKLRSEIFTPVLQRYRYPEETHKYVLLYYLNGIIAIVTEWIRSGLVEPPEQLAAIIMNCVLPDEHK